MTFSKFIIISSHLPILITVGYSVVIYKGLGNALKAFSHFIFVSGIVQFASLLLWFYKRNNLPILHFYVVFGFVFLAWFYKIVLKGFINEKILFGIALAFLIFTTLNSLLVQNIFTFNSNALTIESLLIVILTLCTYIMLLYEEVRDTSRQYLKSLKWINSGFFIYYSSCILIFYFGDHFTRHFPVYLNQFTWIFNSLFSVVMYCCFFVGLWKRPVN